MGLSRRAGASRRQVNDGAKPGSVASQQLREHALAEDQGVDGDALVHAMHSVAKIVEPASVASPTELRSILSSGHNGLRGATLRQLGVVNQ